MKWKLNELKYKTVSDPETRITLLSPSLFNHNILYLDKEQILIDLYEVLFNIKYRHRNMIKKIQYNLKPKVLLQLVYRLKRNSLIIRTGSHIGEQLPYNVEEKNFCF